jgi:hypothetical protein
VYESQLVSIAGADLLDVLAKNMEELANSMAHGLDTSSLGSLQVPYSVRNAIFWKQASKLGSTRQDDHLLNPSFS